MLLLWLLLMLLSELAICAIVVDMGLAVRELVSGEQLLRVEASIAYVALEVDAGRVYAHVALELHTIGKARVATVRTIEHVCVAIG